MMTGLTRRTPVEIDTEIAALLELEAKATYRLSAARHDVTRYLEQAKSLHEGWPDKYPVDYRPFGLDKAEAEIEKYKDALRTVRREIEPLDAEYERRGRWSRFFLVLNGNGHCHSSRGCSTCFPTTQFGWVYTLSGHTEDEAVAEYGEKMCTVCFPSAPVSKFWGEGRIAREAREAKEAEKQAKQAAKTAAAVVDPETGRTLFKTERAARNELSNQVDWLVSSERHQPSNPEHEQHLAKLAREYRERALRVARVLGAKLHVSPEGLFDEYYAKKEAVYRKQLPKQYAEAVQRGHITEERAAEALGWLKQKGYL